MRARMRTTYRKGMIAGVIVLAASILLAMVSGTDGLGVPGRELALMRAPRIMAALMVGSSLSVVGLALLAVWKNPLADPYILGISGGSAVGGAIAMALPISGISLGFIMVEPVFFFSFAGGVLTTFLITVMFMRGARGGNIYSILLSGFALNAFSASVIMFIQAVVLSNRMQEVVLWLVGNFSDVRISWGYLLFYLPFYLVAMVMLYRNTARLNALSLGHEQAQALGVNPAKVKRIVFISSAVVVAISVALVGMIGFIGIIIPQALRLFFGADLRGLLPLCALFGAAFLIIADSISRLLFTVMNGELPVGIISSLVGAPLFIYLLRKEVRA